MGGTAIPSPRRSQSNYASASKNVWNDNHLYMYSNPSYTDQELEWFEDSWGSSVAGAVIDKLVEYTFGNGLKPIFELIDDHGLDDDQKKSALKKYEKELEDALCKAEMTGEDLLEITPLTIKFCVIEALNGRIQAKAYHYGPEPGAVCIEKAVKVFHLPLHS